MHSHIRSHVRHNVGQSLIGASVDHVLFYNAVLTTSRAAENMGNALKHSKDPLHGLTFKCSGTFTYLLLKKKTLNYETTALLSTQDAEMEKVQAA